MLHRIATVALATTTFVGAQLPSYTIDRPDALLPDSDQSWGAAISDSGQVVGTYRADDFKRTKVFVWQDGAILQEVLPQPWDRNIQPRVVVEVHRHLRGDAIHPAGYVFGNAITQSPLPYEAFYASFPVAAGTYPALHASAAGVSVHRVSDVSPGLPMLVVGQADFILGTQPLRIETSGYTQRVAPIHGPDLNSLVQVPSFGGGDYLSAAEAVNAAETVVGWAEHVDGYRHAFSWDGSALTDLGTLGGPSSSAWAISDSGVIAGQADLANGEHHAFILPPGGSMQDLGTLGGGASVARGINDDRIVVGSSWTADGGVRAFAWYGGGALVDLNRLIPPESGWVLQYAEAINSSGQITGFGRWRGQTRAFVLTPVGLTTGRRSESRSPSLRDIESSRATGPHDELSMPGRRGRVRTTRGPSMRTSKFAR